MSFFALFFLIPNFVVAEKQVTTTDVGTYDVSLQTNPISPQPGEKTSLYIEVISKTTAQPQVHVDYQIMTLKEDQIIFTSPKGHTHSGSVSDSFTFDSAGQYTIDVFIDGIVFQPIPTEIASFILDVGEPQTLLPKSEIIESQVKSEVTKTMIPEWIKNVADFWITDQINEEGFIQIIEYLVKEKIITIPYAEAPEGDTTTQIPSWIKTSTEFWVSGDISDDEFAIGLEWLINNGVIQVQDAISIPVSVYEIEENYYPIVQFSPTPISPDCPDYHLHATSGYTTDAILTSFTDHNPDSCGLGTVDSLIKLHFTMSENQILEWEKVTRIKILK